MSLFVEPEGATQLNADDVAGLKFDHITTREELNELENANILQAVFFKIVVTLCLNIKLHLLRLLLVPYLG